MSEQLSARRKHSARNLERNHNRHPRHRESKHPFPILFYFSQPTLDFTHLTFFKAPTPGDEKAEEIHFLLEFPDIEHPDLLLHT